MDEMDPWLRDRYAGTGNDPRSRRIIEPTQPPQPIPGHRQPTPTELPNMQWYEAKPTRAGTISAAIVTLFLVTVGVSLLTGRI